MSFFNINSFNLIYFLNMCLEGKCLVTEISYQIKVHRSFSLLGYKEVLRQSWSVLAFISFDIVCYKHMNIRIDKLILYMLVLRAFVPK